MNQQISEKERRQLLFEVTFYEGIIRGQPDYVDALIPLGDAYTKLGMYQKGLNIDLRLARLQSKDPVVWYNLACSYSLLNSIEEAFDALKKAIKLGYKDFRFMDRDPDLGNIREDKRYQQLKQLSQNLKSET